MAWNTLCASCGGMAQFKLSCKELLVEWEPSKQSHASSAFDSQTTALADPGEAFLTTQHDRTETFFFFFLECKA